MNNQQNSPSRLEGGGGDCECVEGGGLLVGRVSCTASHAASRHPLTAWSSPQHASFTALRSPSSLSTVIPRVAHHRDPSCAKLTVALIPFNASATHAIHKQSVHHHRVSYPTPSKRARFLRRCDPDHFLRFHLLTDSPLVLSHSPRALPSITPLLNSPSHYSQPHSLKRRSTVSTSHVQISSVIVPIRMSTCKTHSCRSIEY